MRVYEYFYLFRFILVLFILDSENYNRCRMTARRTVPILALIEEGCKQKRRQMSSLLFVGHMYSIVFNSLPQKLFCTRMIWNCTRMIWRKGWIAPGYYEEKGCIASGWYEEKDKVFVILFFKSSWCKIASDDLCLLFCTVYYILLLYMLPLHLLFLSK